jgi:Carboxypeptidase regulatory-like domain
VNQFILSLSECRLKHCPLLLALLFLFPLLGFAQSTNATVSGGVTDPSGNFISDADVNIANDATGVIYSAKSNGSGMYLVPILPPGHYHVQVSKPGYKTIIKADVVLNVQSAVALNFILPVGATSESITIDADAPLINTTNASVSTVIDRKFVENTPLNGRSFQDLISMTPGVATQSSQAGSTIGYSGDFSVNGQRGQSNYYTVDGVSANVGAGNGFGGAQPASGGAIAATSALGTTQSLVSVDALQEFRVQGSTYSAEFGRSPGGQFSFLTRSGTNQFHGSTFDYFRNDLFDANDWFNDYYGRPKPALRQNDFGGTIGGPITIPHIYNGQNRTFFFGSYEGLRITQPQAAQIQYVPDMAIRNTAPAKLQPLLNAFPLPTPGAVDYGLLAQFIQPYSVPSQIDSGSIRLDATLRPGISVFFRYATTPSSTNSRYLSNVTKQDFDTNTYTFGTTTQLRDHIVNEFRLGYAASTTRQITTLDSFGGAVPVDLAELMGISDYQGSAQTFELYVPGVGLSDVNLNQTNNEARQWNIVNVVHTSFGHSQYTLGIDYRRIKSPITPVNLEAVAIYNTAASIINNQVFEEILAKSLPATPIYNEFAAFAEDEWQVTPRLGLSLGLRWEVNPPPTEQHGNDAYTLLGSVANPSTLSLAPRGTSLWNTTYLNFAPRIGAAWQAHDAQGRETVVRAGAGVFFDTDNEFASLGFAGLGFYASQVSSGSALPVTSTQLNFSPAATAPYTSSTVYAFPSHLQLPYTLQWNTAVQQALGRRQSVTVTYVGAAGRRLLQNQTRSIAKFKPEFSSIAYLATGVTSNYQALQVQFQRSMEYGIQALGSYTWSHSLDYGSTYSALTVTRGNSDFDLRHNLQAGLSWDAPVARKKGYVAALITGWGVDGRAIVHTGFPVTITGNYLTDPTTGQTYYSEVNLNPNVPVYLRGSQYPGGRIINKNAFGLPSGMSQGTAPRNFVRGFGEAQVNLAIRREVALQEKLHLQFRAESFNILNHPNFGYIVPNLSNAQFGQATMMLNQSLGTVAPQYQQGGPRSTQFSLKALF